MSDAAIRSSAHEVEARALEAFGAFTAFPVLQYLETLGSMPSEGKPGFHVVDPHEIHPHLAEYDPTKNQFLVSEPIYDAALSKDSPLYHLAIYILTHELGHWKLKHFRKREDTVLAGLDVSALPGQDSEDQADKFADELLMSTNRLSRKYNNNLKIAKAFEVTPKHASKRIRDLHKERFWTQLAS